MKYTIAGLIVLFCTGCFLDRGSSVGGPKATHEEVVTEFDEKGKVTKETKITTEAQGPTSTGAATKSWKAPPMTVNSDGAEIGDGGGTFYDYESIKATATNMRFLYALGGFAILGGALLCFANWKLGAMLAGAGAMLIALTRMVNEYPWIIAIPILAGVGIAVWFVIDHRRGKRHTKALTTLVKHGQNNEELKKAVANDEASDKSFRKTIDTVKDNLHI